MGLNRRIFFLLLGILSVFCCFSLVTSALDKIAQPLPNKVMYFITTAVFLAICLYSAIASFYCMFSKEQKVEDYEYYDIEKELSPKLKVRETQKEILSFPEILITEDKPTDIPCEVYWLGRWHEAKTIREIKLLTGISEQFCPIYLVELGQSPPIRQWVNAELIRKPSGERWESKA